MKRRRLKEEIWKLQPGESLNRNPNQPIISIVRNGQLTYLWIGNNAPSDKFCFATLSGPARLRKLAEIILLEVAA